MVNYMPLKTGTVRLAILGALSAGRSLHLGAAARDGRGHPADADRAPPHGDRRSPNDAHPRHRWGSNLITFTRFEALTGPRAPANGRRRNATGSPAQATSDSMIGSAAGGPG